MKSRARRGFSRNISESVLRDDDDHSHNRGGLARFRRAATMAGEGAG